MFEMQIAIIALLLGLFLAILALTMKKFGQSAKATGLLAIPLFVFSLGFVLRLSGKSPLIDLGFFLTDFSGLFVSVLFMTFLFLGQLKYWEK